MHFFLLNIFLHQERGDVSDVFDNLGRELLPLSFNVTWTLCKINVPSPDKLKHVYIYIYVFSG